MLRNLALLAVAMLSTSSVLAQNPGSFGRPPGPGTPGYRAPVSPYLNLSRGGNAAINYYGLVRPQVEGSQALQSIERQLSPTGPVMTTEPTVVNPGAFATPGVLPSTPTPTGDNVISAPGFMTHSRYFQNHPASSSGAGAGRPGGMPSPRPQRTR